MICKNQKQWPREALNGSRQNLMGHSGGISKDQNVQRNVNSKEGAYDISQLKKENMRYQAREMCDTVFK